MAKKCIINWSWFGDSGQVSPAKPRLKTLDWGKTWQIERKTSLGRFLRTADQRRENSNSVSAAWKKVKRNMLKRITQPRIISLTSTTWIYIFPSINALIRIPGVFWAIICSKLTRSITGFLHLGRQQIELFLRLFPATGPDPAVISARHFPRFFLVPSRAKTMRLKSCQCWSSCMRGLFCESLFPRSKKIRQIVVVQFCFDFYSRG